MKNLIERKSIDHKTSVEEYIRVSKEYTIENLKKSNLEQVCIEKAIEQITHTPNELMLLCETYSDLTYDIGSQTTGASAGRNDTGSFRKRKVMDELLTAYVELKIFTDTTKKEVIVSVTKLFNSLI